MTLSEKETLATRLKLEKERAAILARLRHVDTILTQMSASIADHTGPEEPETRSVCDGREAL